MPHPRLYCASRQSDCNASAAWQCRLANVGSPSCMQTTDSIMDWVYSIQLDGKQFQKRNCSRRLYIGTW